MVRDTPPELAFEGALKGKNFHFVVKDCRVYRIEGQAGTMKAVMVARPAFNLISACHAQSLSVEKGAVTAILLEWSFGAGACCSEGGEYRTTDGHVWVQISDNHLEPIQKKALIKKASEGSAQAAFDLGYTFYTELNYSDALHWFDKAAGLGDARMAYEIAILFRDGDIGFRDGKKMISYLQKAAKRGLDLAQMELGTSYLQGTSIEQDVAKATYWYEQAAKTGNAKAQFTLSTLYGERARGFEQASMTADGKIDEMDAALSSDNHKALYWLCQAALQSYGDAQLALGRAYGTGAMGLPVSSKERRFWLQWAADDGLEEAQEELATPWYYGVKTRIKELFEPSVEGCRTPRSTAIPVDSEVSSPQKAEFEVR
jgi:TPR repeat protein